MPRNPAKPRTTKTPEQRAEETLDTARRVEVKATSKAAATTADAKEAAEALLAARQRLAYAGSNPDLPEDRRQGVQEYLESVGFGSTDPDTTGDDARGLEPVLLAYSEWLDGEGLVKTDQGDDADKRTHDDLVHEFLHRVERQG